MTSSKRKMSSDLVPSSNKKLKPTFDFLSKANTHQSGVSDWFLIVLSMLPEESIIVILSDLFKFRQFLPPSYSHALTKRYKTLKDLPYLHQTKLAYDFVDRSIPNYVTHLASIWNDSMFTSNLQCLHLNIRDFKSTIDVSMLPKSLNFLKVLGDNTLLDTKLFKGVNTSVITMSIKDFRGYGDCFQQLQVLETHFLDGSGIPNLRDLVMLNDDKQNAFQNVWHLRTLKTKSPFNGYVPMHLVLEGITFTNRTAMYFKNVTSLTLTNVEVVPFDNVNVNINGMALVDVGRHDTDLNIPTGVKCLSLVRPSFRQISIPSTVIKLNYTPHHRYDIFNFTKFGGVRILNIISPPEHAISLHQIKVSKTLQILHIDGKKIEDFADQRHDPL